MILSKINIFIYTISLIFISCDNFFVSDKEQANYQCEIENQYCSDENQYCSDEEILTETECISFGNEWIVEGSLTKEECISSGNEWVVKYNIEGVQKTLGPTYYDVWEYFS